MTTLYDRRVSPFGHLRVNAYLQLTAAFRSLSRPSSALDAKAFSLRSCQLDLFKLSLLRSISKICVLISFNFKICIYP